MSQKIIDIHTHAFPDKLAAKAIGNLEKHTGPYKPYTNGTVKNLLCSMDDAGIETACVLNIATAEGHAEAIRKWSREISSDRLIPVGSVYPYSADWAREIEDFSSDGMRGIKFHPMHQNFAIDDRKMFPIYEHLCAKNMFVIFHAGNDIMFPKSRQSSVDKISRINAMFPKLKIVAAHFGGWQDWPAAYEHLCGRNVFIDTSFIHEVPADVMANFFSKHNSDLFLFGSDSPWCSQRGQVDFITNLRLINDEYKEKIFSRNVSNLLN